MIKVLLVDHHLVVRSGLRLMLEEYADIEILAEADNGDDGYKLCLDMKPDVLILDMNMPNSSGLATLGQLIAREPESRVIMFSPFDEVTYAIQAISAGAKGYLLKSSNSAEVVQAIRQVVSGKSYLSTEVAQNIALHNINPQDNPLRTLTSREFEIFRLLAEGDDIESIAQRLKIGHKTVANYQTALKHKLNISSPIQLVRLALKFRVITLNLSLVSLFIFPYEV